MIFDIIVIIILLISALHAFWRGFIREVLTIFGALGGLFAAITFGAQMRPIMDGWLGITDPEKAGKLFEMIPMTIVSNVLAYGLIFFIVFGILSFISHLIAEQIRALGLGAVDRTLGVVFGLARGFLILGLFYLPVHIVMDDKSKDEYFKESRSQPYVEGMAAWIESVMPDDLLPLQDENKKDDTKKEDGARETLQNLDVLKTDANKDTQPAPVEGEKKPETGYGDQQRKTLDTLIEKGIDTGIEKLTPKN
jgi:membrane protein required for colicin V production